MAMPCDPCEYDYDPGPQLHECPRCEGSGEIARFIATGSYVCAGPVPDYARGVTASRCDICNGHGMIEEPA